MFLSNAQLVKAIVLKNQWELTSLYERGNLILGHPLGLNDIKHSLECLVVLRHILASGHNEDNFLTGRCSSYQVKQGVLRELLDTHLIHKHHEFSLGNHAWDRVKKTLFSAETLGKVLHEQSLLWVSKNLAKSLKLGLSDSLCLSEVNTWLLGVVGGRGTFLVSFLLLLLTIDGWVNVLLLLEVVSISSSLLHLDSVDWGRDAGSS